jgi:hypothetical protein
MALIEIGRRNYLLYLVLPHPVKMALLSEDSRAKLDAINRLSNETSFSGDGASNYDQNHRYGEAEQHDHPCRRLIEGSGPRKAMVEPSTSAPEAGTSRR